MPINLDFSLKRHVEDISEGTIIREDGTSIRWIYVSDIEGDFDQHVGNRTGINVYALCIWHLRRYNEVGMAVQAVKAICLKFVLGVVKP